MRQRGFSLIELLIVVAIILVIAAIAIPNLINSRIAANEASAISSIRAVNTAQVTYAVTYPDKGYATDLATLGAPDVQLLDWVLGCTTQPCPKSGYRFRIINTTGTPVDSYSVVGVPTDIGITGHRGFCSDRMNPVLADPTGRTNCTEPLQ